MDRQGDGSILLLRQFIDLIRRNHLSSGEIELGETNGFLETVHFGVSKDELTDATKRIVGGIRSS